MNVPSGNIDITNCIIKQNTGKRILSIEGGNWKDVNITNNTGDIYIMDFDSAWTSIYVDNTIIKNNNGKIDSWIWGFTFKNSIYEGNSGGIGSSWGLNIVQSKIVNISNTPAIYYGSPINIYSSLIANNKAGVKSRDGGKFNFYNSIFYNNAEYDANATSTTEINTIANSFIDLNKVNGYTNTSSIYSGIPGFIDAMSGNYHLNVSSQLIDKGDENTTYNIKDFDLDGKTRIIGTKIDIGPYEYQ